MNKNRIRITENKLKQIIAESVKKVISESYNEYFNFDKNGKPANFPAWLNKVGTKIEDGDLYHLCMNLHTIIQHYNELMNSEPQINTSVYNISKFLHDFAPSEKQRNIPTEEEVVRLQKSLVTLLHTKVGEDASRALSFLQRWEQKNY